MIASYSVFSNNIIDSSSKDKPKMIESWVTSHRKNSFGGFIDAICDKAFLIPCWIILLGVVPLSVHFKTLQYTVLWLLIFTEIYSGCVRFKAYYVGNGVVTPVVHGFDFSTSAVKVLLNELYAHFHSKL